MPGETGEPRGDYARMLSIFCIRGCGCVEHPAFPTPFAFWAVRFLHHSGVQASRDREGVFASLFEIPTRGATAPHFPSSPGLTGRFSIPEGLVTSREAAAYWIPAFAGMTRLHGGATRSRGRRRGEGERLGSCGCGPRPCGEGTGGPRVSDHEAGMAELYVNCVAV